MNEDFIFPRWLCRLLSYISVFTCGAYAYAAIHGHPPELYRVVLTCLFGIMFFVASINLKSKQP
jgi:hypothetical protein